MNKSFHYSYTLETLLRQHSEAEAMLTLIQHWTGENGDITLKHGLDVLEDCLLKLYRSIKELEKHDQPFKPTAKAKLGNLDKQLLEGNAK